MTPRWTLFHGMRSAQGKFCVTVRNGPYVATSSFKDTLEEALAEAGVRFEKEFHPLVSDETNLSEMLSED